MMKNNLFKSAVLIISFFIVFSTITQSRMETPSPYFEIPLIEPQSDPEPSIDELWNKTFCSTYYGYDRGYSVQETIDGGYIIAGVTQTTCGWDAWLIKTDENGSKQWDKTFRRSDVCSEMAMCVQQTTDGGYIILANANCDGWLIKTDGNGTMVWNKTIGSANNYEWMNDVKQTSDGGYILIGKKDESMLMIKINPDGSEQWMRMYTLDPFKIDSGVAVVQTDDGGYIAIGRRAERIGEDDIKDIYTRLIRTDENGELKWEKYYRCDPDLMEEPVDIIKSQQGGYLLLMDIIGPIFGTSSPTDASMGLIKIDENGNVQWTKLFLYGIADYPSEVKQINDGGYVIVGSLRYKKKDYIGVYPWREGMIFKINDTGAEEWVLILTGHQNDTLDSVYSTKDGSYIVTGSTESYGHGSQHHPDLWLVKLRDSPTKPLIRGDAEGDLGQSLAYTFISYDQQENSLFYYIDWGDNTTTGWIGPYPSGENITQSHAWMQRGYYQMRIKSRDSVYNTESFTQTYLVSISNDQPSSPIITGQNTVIQGHQYIYTFTSRDSDGDNLYYYVDWGDGPKGSWFGPYPENTTLILNHTYQIWGNFSLRSQAKDIFGELSPWTVLNLTMINHPPTTPLITGEIEGTIWEKYTFTFVSTDEDDHNLSYLIGWGDGQTGNWIGPYHSGKKISLEHTWYQTGEYTIQAKAKDGYGKESDWGMHTITIRNEAPTAPIISGIQDGRYNEPYNYTVVSTDPEGYKIAYYIDWGDRTYEDWTRLHPSGKEIIFSHTYREKGTYLIKAKARDEGGLESLWGSLEVVMPQNYKSLIFFLFRLLECFLHQFKIFNHPLFR